MQVVMAPANHIYLDMKQSSNSPLGQTWACSVCDVVQAYNWGSTAPTGDLNTYLQLHVGTATTLFAAANAGDTNVKVVGLSTYVAGGGIRIDTGGSVETHTITSVGSAGTNTTLFSATSIGDTNIKVASVGNLTAGDAMNVNYAETVTISSVGTQGRSITLFAASSAGEAYQRQSG